MKNTEEQTSIGDPALWIQYAGLNQYPTGL